LIRLSDTRTTRSEPLERVRIQTLERTLARERAIKEAEKNDRIEMRSRLDIWDDDESDELLYTGRYVTKFDISM
jgi:RNA-binding protein 25